MPDLNFDEAPEQNIEHTRTVPQDVIIDLQCRITAMLKNMTENMNNIADALERIEKAITDGTDKADEGIQVTKNTTKALKDINETTIKLVEALKGNGTG